MSEEFLMTLYQAVGQPLRGRSPAPLAPPEGPELRSSKTTCVEACSSASAHSKCPENVPSAPPSFLRLQIARGHGELSLYGSDQ